MKKKILTSISVLLLIFEISGFSGENEKKDNKTGNNSNRNTSISKLTFNDYISLVKEKIPELKRHKLMTRKAENTVDGAKGVEDILFTTGFNYFNQDDYMFSGVLVPYHTEGSNYNAGLEKVFSSTGTRVYAGVDYTGYDAEVEQMGMSFSSYEPSVTIGIVQPVLFNSFGMLDRFAKKDAEMKLEIARLKEQLNNLAVMTYYSKLYYKWIELKININTVKATIANAKKFEDQVNEKLKKNVADNDDFQKARSAVLKYEDNLSMMENIYGTIIKELNVVIGIDKPEPDESELEQAFNKAVGIDLVNVPFEKTSTGKIYELVLNNLKYNRDAAENKCMPHLDLIGRAVAKSNRDNFSDSYSNMKDRELYIGMSFSYPLGNHRNESEAENVRLAIGEFHQEREIKIRDYTKSLKSIMIYTEGNRKRLDINNRNLDALNSRQNTENRKYRQARLNLWYLLDTRNSILQQKIAIAQLKNDIVSAHLDYEQITK